MIRNLRAVLKEKNMSLDELACRTGIQKSVLELIMLGAYQADGNYRRLIADALEEYDHTIFESGLKDHRAPLK